MTEIRVSDARTPQEDLGSATMRMPDEVMAMLELKRRGWGVKRIAREFGACPKTVRAWIKAGGWRRYRRPGRPKKLDGLEAWLEQRLVQHRGNADVVRQELADELGIKTTLRTVERAVEPFRQRLEAERRATVRFETPPGKQLQIDFGVASVMIARKRERVHLFVATLGYSLPPAPKRRMVEQGAGRYSEGRYAEGGARARRARWGISEAGLSLRSMGRS